LVTPIDKLQVLIVLTRFTHSIPKISSIFPKNFFTRNSNLIIKSDIVLFVLWHYNQKKEILHREITLPVLIILFFLRWSVAEFHTFCYILYFYQILTTFNKLKIMSEVEHDNWKWLKLFTWMKDIQISYFGRMEEPNWWKMFIHLLLAL
jgi:hypothetical protein